MIQAVTNHTCTVEAPVQKRGLDKDIKHAQKRVLADSDELIKDAESWSRWVREEEDGGRTGLGLTACRNTSN